MTHPDYDYDPDNAAYDNDDAKVDAYRRLLQGQQGLLDDPDVFEEDDEFTGFDEKDF